VTGRVVRITTIESDRQAVERMTVELLDERDSEAEVRGWLEAIAEMVAG